jgi:hypothetical protein
VIHAADLMALRFLLFLMLADAAQAAPRFTLAVDDPGACLDRPRVVTAVRERLAPREDVLAAPDDGSPARRLLLVVDGAHVSATLQLDGEEGAARTIGPAESCQALEPLVVIAIAVFLESFDLFQPPPPAKPPALAPVVVEERAPERRLPLELTLRGGASLGRTPAAAMRTEVGFGIDFDPAAAELALAAEGAAAAPLDEGAVRIILLSARPSLCMRAAEGKLSLCAVGEAGAAFIQGAGGRATTGGIAPQFAAGASGELQFPLARTARRGALHVVVRGSAIAPFVRVDVRDDDTGASLWTAPIALAAIDLGILWRL